MDIYKLSERLMSMDDAAWMRYANPWSVFTRFSCLPLIAIAIWSRDWIGWYALIPVALAVFWTWVNPRLFSKPASTDHWAAKGTFGERIFLDRKKLNIPGHHVRMANLLAALSVPGVLVMVYGLIVLNPWAVVLGLPLAMLPKVWFVDRMVWLYEDMKDADPKYQAWLR